MNEREALKLALEALEEPLSPTKRMKAITAIKEALAQHDSVQAKPEPEHCKYGYEPKSCTSDPMNCQCAHDAVLEMAEQEPVAWMEECADFWEHYTYINEAAQEKYNEDAKMWIEKLRTTQPQPEQEPVARVVNKSVVFRPCDLAGLPPNAPLYTSPPQRKPLTDEEIDRRLHPTNNGHEHDDRFWDGVEWAKAQLKEKNT